MRPIDNILARLEAGGFGPRRSGAGWRARCPAHDDHDPSLSIDMGDKGGAVVYCHAGCPTERVVAALGMSLAALMPDDSRRPGPNGRPKPNGKPMGKTTAPPPKTYASANEAVAELERKHGRRANLWTYQGADMEPVGLVVRWNTPAGRRIRPVSKTPAGWVIGGMSVPRPLYRLPELLAADPAEPVFVVEGEKCADAAAQCGLLAVTSAGGAQAADKTDWGPVKGRVVVIVPDRDEPGESYAANVAALARKAGAASVKILRLADHAPGLPEGGDLADVVESSDWCGIGLGDAATPKELGHLLRRLAEAAPQAQPDKARLARLFDMKPEPVGWLWPGRIPLGRLSLLAGMPGVGKSWLVLDAAARISTGTPWPDGLPCPQGSVLLLAAEDDLRDTIRPRLDAMHADTRRVYAFTAVRRVEGGKAYEASVRLWDIDAIEEAIAWLHDCRLVAIDPIGSYLGSQTDGNAESQVRAVLEPLADLARKHNVAVVMVAHRRKMRAYIADDYVLGSRAFTGLARATWHVTRDPNDSSKLRRLFLPGKNNLATTTSGLAFSIYGEPPQVVWERNPVNITADDALAAEIGRLKRGPKADAQAKAETLLRQSLAGGPRLATEVEAELLAQGVSERTIRRAREAVGVVLFRPVHRGPWWWRLPDHGADSLGGQVRPPPLSETWPPKKNPGKTAILGPSDGLGGQVSALGGELGHLSPDPPETTGMTPPGGGIAEDREQFVV